MNEIEKIQLLKYLCDYYQSSMIFRNLDEKLNKIELKEWKSFLFWGRDNSSFKFEEMMGEDYNSFYLCEYAYRVLEDLEESNNFQNINNENVETGTVNIEGNNKVEVYNLNKNNKLIKNKKVRKFNWELIISAIIGIVGIIIAIIAL